MSLYKSFQISVDEMLIKPIGLLHSVDEMQQRYPLQDPAEDDGNNMVQSLLAMTYAASHEECLKEIEALTRNSTDPEFLHTVLSEYVAGQDAKITSFNDMVRHDTPDADNVFYMNKASLQPFADYTAAIQDLLQQPDKAVAMGAGLYTMIENGHLFAKDFNDNSPYDDLAFIF